MQLLVLTKKSYTYDFVSNKKVFILYNIEKTKQLKFFLILIINFGYSSLFCVYDKIQDMCLIFVNFMCVCGLFVHHFPNIFCYQSSTVVTVATTIATAATTAECAAFRFVSGSFAIATAAQETRRVEVTGTAVAAELVPACLVDRGLGDQNGGILARGRWTLGVAKHDLKKILGKNCVFFCIEHEKIATREHKTRENRKRAYFIFLLYCFIW